VKRRLSCATRPGSFLASAGAALLVACYERQSVIHPAGPQSNRIATHWWLMLGIAALVYLIAVAFLLLAAFRRRPADDSQNEATVQRSLTLAVAIGTVTTVVILFVFLVTDFTTGRALAAGPPAPPLTIEITGYQWWWKVLYPDSVPSRSVQTANEIHIPVGRPVVIRGSAPDVIHSFWVPNLHGKKDLIPGKKTTTWFQADTPGVYRGQCAEFCGHQHAKMAMFVVAEAPAQFAAWLDRQRQPAPEPADPLARKGREVFLAGPCAMCHNITGTSATGQVAPDLTHIASRLTIAAGTLPNTRRNLATWILDPQRIKPGTKMPPTELAPADLQALLTYLESLR
jgi:cytochrome c oxidase subunit 2